MMKQQPQEGTDALADLRRQIDGLDAELVALLAKRQRCVEGVIEVKRAQGIPARIPQRIDEVLARVRGLASVEKLDPDIAVAIWREMIEQFIDFEERRISASRRPS